MRHFPLSLLALMGSVLSCTAQKQYEWVRHIKDSAHTLDQLDSTVNVFNNAPSVAEL